MCMTFVPRDGGHFFGGVNYRAGESGRWFYHFSTITVHSIMLFLVAHHKYI